MSTYFIFHVYTQYKYSHLAISEMDVTQQLRRYITVMRDCQQKNTFALTGIQTWDHSISGQML